MGTLGCLLRKIRLAKARLIFLDKQTLVSISVMGRSDVFYISSINFPILLAKQLPNDIDLFTAFVMTHNCYSTLQTLADLFTLEYQ